MKMKKILCLILALVMVASMAACGSDSKQPADSEAASGESAAPSGDEGSASADLSSIKVGAIVNVVKGDGGWC